MRRTTCAEAAHEGEREMGVLNQLGGQAVVAARALRVGGR